MPRGRAGFLAISGHKPMGTKADQDQQDQDQHGPRGRASSLSQADQDQPDQDPHNRGRAIFPRYGKHWCGMIVPQFTQIHHWLPPLFPVTKCPQ